MNEAELAHCHAALDLPPGATLEELERAFMKKNFALIRGKTGDHGDVNAELEAQRAKLRAAHDALAAHLKAQVESAPARKPQLQPVALPPPRSLTAATLPSLPSLPSRPATPPVGRTLIAPPPLKSRAEREAAGGFVLFAFDSWLVNVLVPPLLFLGTWLLTISPAGFFLKGFHVWMHEFGHATAAWFCGHKATPLPFGWTPVEPAHSDFVYYGLLLMFAILFLAGLKERKVWPMVAAAGLALLQYYMTWRMPADRQEFWWGAFGGVGGEFYLSTLLMMAFYVQLPDKFRWGACRYVFFFLGATAFLNIYLRWRDIYHGLEEIPFGSMINGEDDAGGDMNKLMDDYGWTKFMIRRNYLVLGNGCLVALGLAWAVFALRLNRLADRVLAGGAAEESETV